MSRNLKRIAWLPFFALALHPLGELLCYVWRSTVNQSGARPDWIDFVWKDYWFATSFAASTPFLYALFYFFGPKFLREQKLYNLLSAGFMIGASLYAQISAFYFLSTDAQAALAFIFAPLYVSGYYLIFMLVLILASSILRKFRSSV